MKKKYLFLLISLALPVIIFGFLKYFGRNRFDLPLMHETNAEWPAGCQKPAAFPFTVPDSVLAPSTQPVIVLFALPDKESILRLPVEIDTVLTRFRWRSADSAEFSPCLFGAPEGSGAVLIDADRRVRGIYGLLGRDETDRLIMETRILNQTY